MENINGTKVGCQVVVGSESDTSLYYIKPDLGQAPDASPTLNLLGNALAKAQGKMKAAKKDSDNPYFKSRYADLAEIVDTAREVLSENGLSVVQRILTTGKDMYLHTMLLHSSGQWINSVMPITPVKTDVQAVGAYITYLRRYMFSSMCGVVSADFVEDDDGEGAMELSNEQKSTLRGLFIRLTEAQQTTILTGAKISDINQVNRSKYKAYVDYMNKLIAAAKKEVVNEA